MTAPTGSGGRQLPATRALSWNQYAGRACVWCDKPLTSGAVSAGIARGRQGAHILDVEVWAGPCCKGRLA